MVGILPDAGHGAHPSGLVQLLLLDRDPLPRHLDDA
jgi:hypothetical protein